jgi:aerobic carbon-monoxide dehydrogenase medium subunit
MKPASFEYHAPKTLDEALRQLGSLDNAKILAGGQSLVAMMNFRVVAPDHLIDVNHVAGLSGVTISDKHLRIGAMTRQRDLEFSEEIARHCPLMREATLLVGHRQTRNRGTIGGSLAHADPSAELPNVCSAHDARIEIHGPRGRRLVPIAEFGHSFMTTAVEANEILTAVEIDLWPADHGYCFLEYARRHGDFAIVGVAALLDLDNAGRVTRAALSLCGVDAMPRRLPAVESALIGQILTDEIIEDVTDSAGDVVVLEDHHAKKTYRQHLARVLSARALRDANQRAHRGKVRAAS